MQKKIKQEETNKQQIIEEIKPRIAHINKG